MANGHGGARPGAGAHGRGISQARRLIIRGLTRGLAMAGRSQFGLPGDEEEVAVETIARIGSDLILAGQGRDVLALYAQAAPKSDDGEEEPGGRKSPLVRALERLPGMVQGPPRSREPSEDEENAVIPAVSEPSATYPQSVAPAGQPYFTPQGQLLPPDLDAAEPSREGALVRGPDRAPAGPTGPTPTPRGRASPPLSPDDSEHFEKISPAKMDPA